MKEFIERNIANHLQSCGLSTGPSEIYASSGYAFYRSNVSNSKDAFKEACDHAGQLAEQRVSGFKYKSPKSKSTRIAKKPQEAFNFGSN